MLKTTKSDGRVTEVTISTETYIKVAILIIGALLLIWTVQKITHALLLIFVAFFLTLALNVPVHFIARHLPGKLRGSRALGTTLSFLIVIVILGFFIAYVVPPLARQTENFISAAPHIIREFRDQNGAIGDFIRKYHLQSQVNTLSSELSSRLHNVGGTALSTFTHIGKSIFSLVVIIVLSFMMLSEGPRWLGVFRQLIPEKRHKLADRLAKDMYNVIRGFVNGQVVLAALASVLILPALLILHIGYPVALLVVIFVCGLIPMVGHTIGAIIVTIVALFHSTSAAIIILAYYLLYQQFENYVIQPRIQANNTNMSPLLVFASLIIGVEFGGLFGGLLAIPVAGCLRILVLEYLRSTKIINSKKFENVTTKP